MAYLDLSGMDGFDEWIDHAVNLPKNVQAEMLNAMADVVVEAQRDEANAMLQGPYNKGAVAAAVKKGNPATGGSNPSIKVTFEGTQHGNRLGEIAFVNEYGKTNQPARPFIMTANAKCETETTEAAAEIFYKYLDQ